ncbi:MAG: response regulator transcription factor [Armatimonadetes bacterium]|nr:response regulator transcription factor [Armatimonadota bacterium]
MNLLIVEDDEGIGRFIVQATSEAGFLPRLVGDGAEALRLAQEFQFDMILLDVMVPTVNGFQICRKLREMKVKAPILLLTARDLLEDKVEGLDSGADDYLVKPFQVAELLARMRALLRRGTGSSTIVVGDLELDANLHQVTRAGVRLELSATEYSLLEYLMKNAGRVLTRSMLLQHVWRYDFEGSDNVLDVYISYLRKKIDTDREKSLIRTERGIGYRLGGN